jgi:hypothetical protein
MIAASTPSQACMEAWLNCENLLITLSQNKISSSLRTQQVLDECAQICLSTLHALRHKIQNTGQLAILCVGICEECAEVCDRYRGVLFQNCASACRQCSTTVAKLAQAAL